MAGRGLGLKGRTAVAPVEPEARLAPWIGSLQFLGEPCSLLEPLGGRPWPVRGVWSAGCPIIETAPCCVRAICNSTLSKECRQRAIGLALAGVEGPVPIQVGLWAFRCIQSLQGEERLQNSNGGLRPWRRRSGVATAANAPTVPPGWRTSLLIRNEAGREFALPAFSRQPAARPTPI